MTPLPPTLVRVTDTETRSPEIQLAVGVLAGLRQDLFTDAFAYRPLRPMRTDGPLTRRLPGRIRARAGWTPHAVVLGLALFTLLLAANGTVDFDGPCRS